MYARADRIQHQVLEVLGERLHTGSRPGNRADGLRIVLAIEGGGMRGTVSAGMALALHELGLVPAFDAVYGASAGAITGAWLLSSNPEGLRGWAEPSYAKTLIRWSSLLRGRPVVDVQTLIEVVYQTEFPMDFASVLASPVEYHPSSYLLPENVTAIVNFLVGNGYSHNAAAGIAGNIYQESKGDPESEGMGGGGLIGWTPLPSGLVTGNPAADLQTQLSAILTFNQGWASYLPALNAAATPAAAADIYVTDFERAGIPAASTREASAAAVASACGL